MKRQGACFDYDRPPSNSNRTLNAVKDGYYSEESALKAITINAARHLGVEEQVCSIEEGKDANFVVWSGDSFNLRTEVIETYINGQVVYE